MGRRSVLAIALLTLIAVTAAWFYSQQRAPQTDVTAAWFLPELQARVNDVAQVKIESASDSTLIVRRDGVWVLPERGGYPVDFDKVKRTVLALAELRALEPKTANPDMYWRIGVQDIDQKGATSRRITLMDEAGTPLAALILGNARGRRSNPGLDDNARLAALYVREPGAEQSWLVAGSIEVSARPGDWVDRRIADVQGARVREVRIERAGAAPLVLTRDSLDQSDLRLQDMPEGMVPKSPAMLTTLGTLLTELRFEDVSARAGRSLPEPTTRTTLRTFDGMVAIVTSAVVDGRTQAIFEFEFDPAGVDPAVAAAMAEATGAASAATAQAGEAAAAVPSPDAPEPQTQLPVEAAVGLLNERTAPWIYVLPEFKAAMLTRTRDDLITRKPETSRVQETPAAMPFLGE